MALFRQASNHSLPEAMLAHIYVAIYRVTRIEWVNKDRKPQWEYQIYLILLGFLTNDANFTRFVRIPFTPQCVNMKCKITKKEQ